MPSESNRPQAKLCKLLWQTIGNIDAPLPHLQFLGLAVTLANDADEERARALFRWLGAAHHNLESMDKDAVMLREALERFEAQRKAGVR